MSTLKKILLILLGGAVIGICIAVPLGKITISESWFSVRTLQISLGSILAVLLFLYIQPDKNDKSPKAKGLLIRSRALVGLSFIVFLWGILSQPTLPVTVSFDGVAKTTDVIATNRTAQKTNENVTQVGATVSSFKETQEKKNKEISQELASLKSKIVELDKDEQVRQQATSDQVTDLANNVQKVSVGVDDIKKIDRQTPVSVSTTGTLVADPTRIKIVLAALILMVISFTLSFFYKTYTQVSVKTRRFTIPIVLAVIAVLPYLYPVIVDKISSLSNKNSAPTKDTLVKKNPSIVVDTARTNNNVETQVQAVSSGDSIQEEEKPMVVKPAVSKERKRKKVVQHDDEQPMKVIH